MGRLVTCSHMLPHSSLTISGFVATVNLERTKAFGALVDAAASMIPKL